MGPLIIIPFYKNEHLVGRLCQSLEAIAQELIEHDCSIAMINDSPEHTALAREIKLWQTRITNAGIDVVVFTNEKNEGFIKSTNKGLIHAGTQFRDAILLNSDTYVFPGLLREIFDVAKIDPMIGFICPRSNNATILTYPPDGSGAALSPQEAFALYRKSAHFLPKYDYLPTGIGFCLYIKKTVIKDFGFLDEIYGKGYNEENDYIMRAGRCGYRAAVANYAFVWHEGEQSFTKSNDSRQVLDRQNRAILDSRYPEYSKLVCEFIESANYQSWKAVSKLSASKTDEISALIDFSQMSEFHNGTNEAAKRILLSIVDRWPENIKISLAIKQHVAIAHKISDIKTVNIIDADGPDWGIHAFAFRFGQLFDDVSAFKLFESSCVVLNFMLDTIAMDCGQLAVRFNRDLWQMACDISDVIFTNSSFTASQISHRFDLTSRCELRALLHSTDPRDYFAPLRQETHQPQDTEYILIFGNHYPHKFVSQACRAISQSLPNERIVCFGVRGPNYGNVKHVESGALSDQAIERLINNAKLLVYPSHYEGFGLPLMHAISRGKNIIVRDLPVYREALEQINPSVTGVQFFQYTDQIPELIRIVLHSESQRGFIENRFEYTSRNDWSHTADAILRTALEKIESFDSANLRQRLRRVRLERHRHQVRKNSSAGRILEINSAVRAGPLGAVLNIIREKNRNRLAKRKARRASRSDM